MTQMEDKLVEAKVIFQQTEPEVVSVEDFAVRLALFQRHYSMDMGIGINEYIARRLLERFQNGIKIVKGSD